MQTLKIEMIHDVVCSWCHIGYHNISSALESLSKEVSAEIYYLPFQLNPDIGPLGVDIVEHLCQRNQWSFAEVMAYRENLMEKTKEVGVTIDFGKRTRYYNTDNAHRLILAAGNVGLQRQMHQALSQAYHVEGENISDLGVLAKATKKIGLDEDVVNQAIGSGAISQQLKALVERVGRYSVRSVPAFIFNGSRFVSGSNSADYFEQLIRSEYLDKKLEKELNEKLISEQAKENAPCPM
jgi:predicted DsbA family dithiol-disulfide isomerase